VLRKRPLALGHELGALAEAVPLHHVAEHTLRVLELVQYGRLQRMPTDARVVLLRGRGPLPPQCAVVTALARLAVTSSGKGSGPLRVFRVETHLSLMVARLVTS
jgi:hypothetical protein